MKSLRHHIIAALLFASTPLAFSQTLVQEIKVYKVSTKPFDLNEISGWVLAGSARLPAQLFGFMVMDNYSRIKQDIDLSYLKDTHEMRIAINEEKSGYVKEVTITCKNTQKFKFEFDSKFSFSEEEIIKEKSASRRPYFAAYGAGCSIPLSGLDPCQIEFIDITGHTKGSDGARVRVDFLVPSEGTLLNKDL